MAEHTLSEQQAATEPAEAVPEHAMNQEPSRESSGEDGCVDALAAVALIALFVFTCIYWISGQ